MSKGPINSPDQPSLGLVAYHTSDCATEFRLDAANETVWATQQQMASLFGVSVPNINRHIANIYSAAELDRRGTVATFEMVRQEGGRTVKRSIEHYNLDVILSVGYRVSSQKATAFRRWATQVLRDYLTKGYALNEVHLRRNPDALRELAAKVRALRNDEKARYRAVRDVFAMASVDYDAASDAARAFFAKTQDKFLVAAAGRIAAELILDRADHQEPNMGLRTMKGPRPTKADATIGKNYLNADELRILDAINEMFLLFVESAAMRGLRLTMAEMTAKFDALLAVQGYEVMLDYSLSYKRGPADQHAERELALYGRRIAASPPGAP
jgi:hypothetical protein